MEEACLAAVDGLRVWTCLQKGNTCQHHSALERARNSTRFTMAAAGTEYEHGLALWEAAKAGNAPEVTRLLDRGAPIGWKNMDEVRGGNAFRQTRPPWRAGGSN